MRTSYTQNDRIRFYHVCTDGEDNGILHTCAADYRKAIIISAIVALKTGVQIMCFCHMSTHSHFIIWCEAQEQAEAFAHAFKRDYSRYIYLTYGANCALEGVACTIKEIDSQYYLKRCIAYVLNNPVAAKIVTKAEDYQWSSFDAYFNKAPLQGIPVSSLGVCKTRELLGSRADLGDSGFMVDADGGLEQRSFLASNFVENIFQGKQEFYRALAITPDAEEEMRYVPHIVKFSDTELYAEAISLVKQKYGQVSINLLTKAQKIAILTPLKKRTHVSNSRIARILRMSTSEVSSYLGPQSE